MSRSVSDKEKLILDFLELPFDPDFDISYNELMRCVGKISDMGFKISMTFTEELNIVIIHGFKHQFTGQDNTSLYKPLDFAIRKFIQEYNTNSKLTHP